jgi:hypothetical protein
VGKGVGKVGGYKEVGMEGGGYEGVGKVGG